MEKFERPKMIEIKKNVWEIPSTYKSGMNVSARLYGTANIISQMDDRVFEQIANVAALPGIQKNAFCMPDAHSGYGFPIGGVAAFDPEQGGVISPGGIGFDINCGMRLVKTNLSLRDVKPHLKEVVDLLYKTVPAGVGSKGFVKLNEKQLSDVMAQGSKWCVENGYGWKKDLDHIEENGSIAGADPSKVSNKARSRGLNQLGTLGSGNHYLEIQVVDKKNVFDEKLAKAFGLFDGQIVIMVHCGSRGFGHQIGSDYLKSFLDAMKKYKISILDRELACAPFNSPEGQDYYGAMASGANLAFANRQVILHRIRESFASVFKTSAEDLEMDLIYDVAHNIAKMETHIVDGKRKKLLVHRKGATRCFGPDAKETPKAYKDVGQPVIVGGSMETGSYLCVGTSESEETFASTMHGSGRTMSRTQAKQQYRGDELQKSLEKRGIYVRAVSMPGLAEEAGGAYKDIHEVVKSMDDAGISKSVVSLKPIGNVKG